MSYETKQQSKLDTVDLDTYSTTLENIFSSIVKKFNKMNLSDHNNQTVTDAQSLLKKGTAILKSMKSHVRSLEILLSDCDDFVEEVIDDLSKPRKEEDFVYHTAGGMLSYPGRDILKDILTKSATKKDTSDMQTSTTTTQYISPSTVPMLTAPIAPIERIVIPEIGYYLKLPVVANLKDIPRAMYYFKGNVENGIPAGIYMNLPNNNIVRMPFPEIIDSKREYDRTHSIRCKYHTLDECNYQRSKMSKMYNSQVRTCNFAHAGDKIIKIGYPSRCPSVPDFGNPTTMSSDIKKVNINDINNMLLYGLNDLMCSVIYLDYNAVSDKTMSSLDKA